MENILRKLLLQKREDNGCWAIHGGGIEIGEKYLETLKREIKIEFITYFTICKYFVLYSSIMTIFVLPLYLLLYNLFL